MLLAHKIELRPTAQQAEYLDRACGSRRHAFNQLLAHFNQEGVKWSKKAANEKYKELRIEFPWYAEVSQRVTRNVVDNLHNGFTHFFRPEVNALPEAFSTQTARIEPKNERQQLPSESQANGG